MITTDELDESSYYSEGEIQTRIKLIGQKSYSAPYIIFSDCYEEPLGGSDDESNPSKAYSESLLQQLELQEPPPKNQAPPKPENDEEELDVDISQRLLELQNKSSAKRQKVVEQEEDDDEEMLIDLDQLDDQNRQMLLEYLHQEYEKNPDQFPFPKELIEEYMLKQG